MRLRLLDRKGSRAPDDTGPGSDGRDGEDRDAAPLDEQIDDAEDASAGSGGIAGAGVAPGEVAAAEESEQPSDQPEARSGPEPNDEQPDPSAAPRRRGRWLALVAALLVVVLALATVAVVLGVRLLHAGDRATDRQAATAVAEQVSTELLTLGYQDSTDTVGRLLDSSTGAMRTQLSALSSTLTSLLQQGQVIADGRVTSSAIESIDDDTAVVLVAAEAVVKNTEIPDGQQRAYRIAVTVQHQGDRWLASAVDFVA